MNSRRLKKIPSIETLWIEHIEKGDRNVQNFLLNVAPLALKHFGFAGDWINRLNVSFYLEGLHAVLNSTTISVGFGQCIRD